MVDRSFSVWEGREGRRSVHGTSPYDSVSFPKTLLHPV